MEEEQGGESKEGRNTRLGDAGGGEDPVPVWIEGDAAADVAESTAEAFDEGVDADEFPVIARRTQGRATGVAWADEGFDVVAEAER